MKTLLTRIDTVFLEVNNLAEAIKWYSETLSLTMRWNKNGYAAFNVGETALTLVQSEQVIPAKHSPFNFFTPDIEAVHRILIEKQVDTDAVVDHRNMKSFDFRDPDGNVLGFCQFDE